MSEGKKFKAVQTFFEKINNKSSPGAPLRTYLYNFLIYDEDFMLLLSKEEE